MNATGYQSVLAYLYRRDGKKGTTAIAAADRLARLEEEYGADWIRQIQSLSKMMDETLEMKQRINKTLIFCVDIYYVNFYIKDAIINKVWGNFLHRDR